MLSYSELKRGTKILLKGQPYKIFDLTKEKIGEYSAFLKPLQGVSGLFFEGKLIDVSLPIKITLKVIEAPP